MFGAKPPGSSRLGSGAEGKEDMLDESMNLFRGTFGEIGRDEDIVGGRRGRLRHLHFPRRRWGCGWGCGVVEDVGGDVVWLGMWLGMWLRDGLGGGKK